MTEHVFKFTKKERITLTLDGPGAGTISDTLDHGKKGSALDTALCTLTSFILALGCAGVAIDTSFRAAVGTAYEAIANEHA